MRAARFPEALAVLLAGLLVAVPATTRAQASKAQALLREAEEAIRSEDFAAAERLFQEAVAADPGSPEASCGLGRLRMALRQYDEAVQSLESCKKLVLAHLRQLQSEQTRTFASIQDEIRELRETIRAIRSGRVKSAGVDRVNQLETAIRELEQMQNRDQVRVEVPPDISFALGTAYLQVGRLNEAEQELLAVLRANPQSGEAHNNLAAVYLAAGRFGEAAERVRLAEAAGAQVNPQMKADIAARHSPGIAPPTPDRQTRTTPAQNEPVSIQHEGRTCAVKGLFVRVVARVTPSLVIHDPIVRFRSEEAAGWYAMTMLPVGEDTFAVTLPKPRGMRSFDYHVEVKSYDETQTRTDDFTVAVVTRREDCPEASSDSTESDGVLIIDVPCEIADAPPVPPGFSIRGTTADIGVLEIGSRRALLAGGAALAGATAVGIAVASKPQESYAGPKPFEDGPGVSFVASNPPPGSTLSLSGGTLSMELRIYSLQDMPGARIIAQLAQSSGFTSFCITLEATHDLEAGRTESVVLSGPTTPSGTACSTSIPIEEVRVAVVGSNGLGGFRTGIPPLSHLRVLYLLTE